MVLISKEPDQEHQAAADTEAAVAQQADIHHRLWMDQLPKHQPHQADGADHTEGRDEPRGESVIDFVSVQQDLQRAEADEDEDQPEYVDVQALGQQRPPLLLQHLRLHNQQPDQCQRQQPDRQVDQKDPVPGEVVGQPATQHRADRRGADHGEAIQRERLRDASRAETCRRTSTARSAPSRRRRCPAARGPSASCRAMWTSRRATSWR